MRKEKGKIVSVLLLLLYFIYFPFHALSLTQHPFGWFTASEGTNEGKMCNKNKIHMVLLLQTISTPLKTSVWLNNSHVYSYSPSFSIYQ